MKRELLIYLQCRNRIKFDETVKLFPVVAFPQVGFAPTGKYEFSSALLCSLWLIFFAMIHLSYLIRKNEKVSSL